MSMHGDEHRGVNQPKMVSSKDERLRMILLFVLFFFCCCCFHSHIHIIKYAIYLCNSCAVRSVYISPMSSYSFSLSLRVCSMNTDNSRFLFDVQIKGCISMTFLIPFGT